MKSSLALVLASFLAAPLLFAQGTGAVDTAPSQPTPTSAASAEGIPLMPPTAPVDSAAQDTGKKKNKKPAGPSKTDAAEDALQLHVKMRVAKTKALEDPYIQAEFAKATATKTDYDRREAYKRYYVLLYSRMLQIDPSIAVGVAARQVLSFARNYQYRVTPTVPRDQVAQAAPTGPENAIAPVGSTPPPRRGSRPKSTFYSE
jgi:hypothetical protein